MLFDGHWLFHLAVSEMPRVVADQRQKFDTDELFVRFSRLSEVNPAEVVFRLALIQLFAFVVPGAIQWLSNWR